MPDAARVTDVDLVDEVLAVLRELGAWDLPHPGGVLGPHLLRTRDRLRDWGADDDLQLVGLAHAFYGTDGFGVALLDHADRSRLIALLGERVEALVHAYASCDRRATYPHLSDRPVVEFTDRWSGESVRLPAQDLAWFAELTVANELDVLLHIDPRVPEHEAWLRGLVESVRDLLSPAAVKDCDRELAPRA